MSKINGEKARQNLRDRKQSKMRERVRALRAAMNAPRKHARTTAAAPAK